VVTARALVVIALLVGAVVGLAACFSLTLGNGTIACSSDPARLCPTGYECLAGHCWLRAGITDGGSD
jgi:hypothetical protein